MPIKNLISAVVLCFFICVDTSFASENVAPLNLDIQDLTWASYQPKSDINKVIEHFKNKYKVRVSAMNYPDEKVYVAGEASPAMSWVIAFTHDSGKLIGMQYEHFKLKNKGVEFSTGRGVKVGDEISNIYLKYGENPKIKKNYKSPPYIYIELEYPFLLKPSSQKGTLKFNLRHRKGTPEKSALLQGMSYKLEP